MVELQSWVGRVQSASDVAMPGPLAGLSGLLDHSTSPWRANELPPLAHWLYFLPRDLQSNLDADGHPNRGDFLPPVPLPRRMWAGSRVRFLSPIGLNAVMKRRSTITGVTSKNGQSGASVFVTVRHEITVGDTLAIIEEQDLVFRGAVVAGDGKHRTDVTHTRRASDSTRLVVPDTVKLFRFSALTFNAHRIHYDRDYACGVEGYPGLVVQGPLVAILLMDHYLTNSRSSSPQEFSFRANRPLFDTSPFELCLAKQVEGADLWAVDTAGNVAVSGRVDTGSSAGNLTPGI